MSAKDKQIDKLWDCVITECTIECEACPALSAEGFMDADEAAVIFYKQGWRYYKGECLCPECVKKKKK